ncbi:MAG: hypothetical protein ISS74_00420 [Planctomycetes bacterium]|nr:hypothetical protein [Planctomycetota bacterium]
MIREIGQHVLAAALSPTERLEAMRNLESFHFADLTRPSVYVPLLLVSVLAVAALVAYRRHRARAALVAAFGRAAGRVEMTPAERTVLARIARAAEPRALNETWTLALAFDDGMKRVLVDRVMRELAPAARRRVHEVIVSLRSKLGLAPAGEASAEASGLVRDARVTLAHPGASPEVGGTVVGVGNREVTVRLDEALEFRTGAAVLRQVRGREQWEFSVAVGQAEGDMVRVRLIGTPQMTNLRRFARVATRRPIHVARYDFAHEGPEGRLPEFAEGTLIEIAGPGLRIEGPIKAALGERVLVVLEVDESRCFRGMGIVRRFTPSDKGPAELAVELTCMNEQEVARLVKETNDTARDAAHGGTPASARAAAA